MGWRRYVRSRVVVNLRTGNAVAGVLYRCSRGLVEVKDAVVHEPGAPAAEADGVIVIELANVDYIQIVG